MSAGTETPARVGIGSRVLRVLQGLLLALFLSGSAPTPTAGISPLGSSPKSQPSASSSGQKAPAEQSIRPTPGLPGAQVQRGARPFLTILCKFPDVQAVPESPTFFERLLDDSYPGLDDYWRSVSYGAISLDGSAVVGWYSMPYGSDTYRTAPRGALTENSVVTADLQRLAEDCTAAIDHPIDWSHYFGINLVFNADLDRPRGGQVCLTRDGVDKCFGATWIWATTATDQALWAHEIGHTFGLRHSSISLAVSNDNVWDVMSDRGACGYDQEYHHVAQEPIAYDKDLLGWIPADRKFVAAPDSTATITLERLALPGGAGYLLAQIPIPEAGLPAAGATTHFYTVEARRQAGYDANLPGEAVVIHEVDTGRESPARPVTMPLDNGDGTEGVSHSSDMWTPGSIFLDAEHGIAVAVEQATPSGFVVTITTRSLPWPHAPRDHTIVPAGSIPFAWQTVPNAVSYELEIAPMAELGPAVPMTATVRSASYSADLTPGFYRWRVRALTATGRQPWTPFWEVTVGRLQPVAETREATTLDALPPGARGRVSIATNEQGDAYAVWAAPAVGSQGSDAQPLLGGAATDVYFSLRAAGGNWGPAVKLNRDPGVYHSSPAIATDGAGNAYAIWTASSKLGYNADIYFAYRPHSAIAGSDNGWSESVRVNDDQGTVAFVPPALVVDLQGHAYAAWIDGRGGHTAIYFAHRLPDTTVDATGVWSAASSVSGDAEAAFSPPSVVADARGNVFLAWEQARRCSGVDISFAGRTAGGTWGAVTRITPNPTGQMLNRPSLAVDAGGAVYAFWQEERGAVSELHAAPCGQNCGLPMAGGSSWGSALGLGQDTDPRNAPAAHIALNKQGLICVSWPDVTGKAGCLELSPLARR